MTVPGTPGSIPPPDPRRSDGRSYDMRYHGTSELRGGNCPQSRYYEKGRFGRIFGRLPPLLADPVALLRLGRSQGPMDGASGNEDHPDGLPAGFTFLGQFIDHDITFDPTSSLERQVDPEAVANFRTPNLELDSVYGSGPGASPHLYSTQRGPEGERAEMLIEQAEGGPEGSDLPRNSQGVALLGDPRNDENLIISQLHLAFLRFHNVVAQRVRDEDLVPPGGSVFETTQRLVRWHYQWIVPLAHRHSDITAFRCAS